MLNIIFRHAQKAKFRFLSSLLFSLFSPHYLFLLLDINRLHFGGKVFLKAFRILGLVERKGRWVVEQDFYGNFRVNVAWFLAFFSCLHDQSCSFWYCLNVSIYPARVSWQSCPWTLKLITSKAAEGSWILTGGYRRLRALQRRMGYRAGVFEPAFKFPVLRLSEKNTNFFLEFPLRKCII